MAIYIIIMENINQKKMNSIIMMAEPEPSVLKEIKMKAKAKNAKDVIDKKYRKISKNMEEEEVVYALTEIKKVFFCLIGRTDKQIRNGKMVSLDFVDAVKIHMRINNLLHFSKLTLAIITTKYLQDELDGYKRAFELSQQIEFDYIHYDLYERIQIIEKQKKIEYEYRFVCSLYQSFLEVFKI